MVELPHQKIMADRDRKNRKIVAVLLLLDLLSEEDKPTIKQRNRKEWVRSWLSRREERGIYHHLVRELALEDESEYRNFFRINKEQFLFILGKIRHAIRKQDTAMRKSINPDERLGVTLRFLATGESFMSQEKSWRISRTLISEAVEECFPAIFRILGPEYLKTPNSEEEWSRIADLFERRWNFPNGLGAIDGKRIIIQQPPNSGSHYYDYKDHDSIILLAVFGPNYECLWADVGTSGRAPDGAIWQRSDLKRLLSYEDNQLRIPKPKPLPGRSEPVPHVWTGDDAFALTTYLMKPYPRTQLSNKERIFNYRLSRMRRISENSFGILASRWRVLRSPILLEPRFVIIIVLAILVLHNLLR